MVTHAGRCRVLQWLQQFLQIHQQVLLYSEQIAENGKFSNRQAANYVWPAGISAGDCGARVKRSAALPSHGCDIAKTAGIKKRAPRRPF